MDRPTHPIKGADVFLRALAELQDVRWTACLIGDGGERVALEALARQLGIGDRVRLGGAVPAAGGLFAAFDLFVLSSRSEGTPLVLLEAMGARTPIVATEVGGIPHMIERDREGWLVPPESPSHLAGAIREALSQPDERKARGARSHARLERDFSAPEWIRRHQEAYRKAMQVRARRRT
jgi:glycosyltransferase involved in cell wall biosynthesis